MLARRHILRFFPFSFLLPGDHKRCKTLLLFLTGSQYYEGNSSQGAEELAPFPFFPFFLPPTPGKSGRAIRITALFS